MVILNLQPLFVMIGSYYLFKERVTILSSVCMIAAVVGSLIIAWGDIGVSREVLLEMGCHYWGPFRCQSICLQDKK
nr:hypothetical protein [Paenibacillus rhizophilus]